MKILYLGYERDAAEQAGTALHGIAQNVTLAWVQSPGAALEWLQHNRDAAAVIVEVHAQSCAPFVEQVRGIGLTTPVIVSGSAPGLTANLRMIVAAAIEQRDRQDALAGQGTHLQGSLARHARIGTALQDRLFELENALRTAEERSATEVA